MKVTVDVEGALRNLEQKTGEKLSRYDIEKEGIATRMTLNRWKHGQSMKTVISIVKLARRTKTPIQKLLKIETQ